ncbi:MAG: arylamine N-acetyltransferase [Methylotenera sp.]|nr:arylamine N-acetyltransferase [Oligoflexia bacterium]
MRNLQTYLKLLGIREERPSLPLLSRIVSRHLAVVPHESVSKLLRLHQLGPELGATIPSLDEFVAGIAGSGFGGTCFAQNFHLNQLLNHLGFESNLAGIYHKRVMRHVSLRVRVDGANYLVDVGLMAPIAGPYRIHPDAAFDLVLGNQRYVFTPAADLENYCLEIHRDAKVVRSFQTTSKPMTLEELETGVRHSFENSAIFMATLSVHRAYENHSVGIWNRKVYRVEGLDRQFREIRNFSELQAAFREDLDLPHYPLELILKLLQENGTGLSLAG